MNQEAGSSLQRRIHARMQEKDTQELVAIWSENDRVEWSSEAFDAVRSILLERLGTLPSQEHRARDEEIESEETLIDLYATMFLRSRFLLGLLWLCSGMAVFLGVALFLDVVTNMTVIYESLWFPILCAVSVVPLCVVRRHYQKKAVVVKEQILKRLRG